MFITGVCVCVLPYYRNITVYCSFIWRCNILQSVIHYTLIQSVMYYSVTLQYDSTNAMCITSIVPKYWISVDEKFLNFQNIKTCTNLTSLVFLPTLKWSYNFNAQIRTKSPWISLYTQLFRNQHTKNNLKQLFLFTPSKVASYPPPPPGLNERCPRLLVLFNFKI